MRIFFMLITLFFLTSCATLLKGYFSELEVYGDTGKLEVLDEHNLPLDIEQITYEVKVKAFQDSLNNYLVKRDTIGIKSIRLRSDRDYLLTLKYANEEKRIMAYKKIGFWWAFFDLLSGGLPIFIDAYTGAWNYYDPVILKQQQ